MAKRHCTKCGYGLAQNKSEDKCPHCKKYGSE